MLAKYRRILNAIYAGGNIFYAERIPIVEGEKVIGFNPPNNGRFEAYKRIALLASDLRRGQ